MTEPTSHRYRPVPKIPDRVEIERAVLNRWNETAVFDQLRARNRGGEPFSFIDGPITANNPMGVHHAWGRTLKDVVQRYNAMNGRDLRWQNGFDCQGLWVEVEVERSLGFNSKREIEAFGLDAFASACRERVTTFAATITEQSRRLGMWMDWDRSYYTMADTNISYIWTFLAECHRRGWLYRGHRLMPWCHRCGTSLSQHELADSYRDMEHPSVFIALPLDGGQGEHISVWTTTPWTLPANVAIAVAPDTQYVLVETGGRRVWVAEARLDAVPITGTVVRACMGSELVGRTYGAVLPDVPVQRDVVHRVVGWSGVSLDEGTGAVHIAPGCGAEDFELGRELELPVLAPLDEGGFYIDGFGRLTGRHVRDVDEEIFGALEASGVLVHRGSITHRYPECWRCRTPLVHRVVDEWFIACDPIRDRMRQAAASVEWHPAHYAKRMDDWLQHMGDWCISRKRYWGLPLPFFTCAFGHLTVISSQAELQARALGGSADDLRELHRPWIDSVVIACDNCGLEAIRLPDVGDCWLDAGIVPFSTLGWRDPELHEYWERWFPAELVCEMHEQIRLWFYSMLFMSVVLDGRAPYRRVLTYGRVNDGQGREMHKSWGNAIWFDDALDEVGADTMRWLCCRQSPARDLNFGYGPARDADRQFLTFWNTYAFFVTYANVDGFVPSAELLQVGPDIDAVAPIDRWLLARTYDLVEACRASAEGLDVPAYTLAWDQFSGDLSNWYLRLSRDRFWTSSDGRRQDKQAAHETLWFALVTAVRCLAPVMPFVADHMWENLVAGVVPEAPSSVHLALYPEPVEQHRDLTSLAAMYEVRRVAELGRSARASADIRRRQPLAAMYVVHSDEQRRRLLHGYESLIARECNVKEVRVVVAAEQFATTEVTPNFKQLGPKFRDDAHRIAASLRAGDYVPTVEGYRVGDWEVARDDVTVRTRARAGYAVAEADGWVVAMDASLTDDLRLEGACRDLVREIQQLRKEHDLDVTARIEVTFPAAAGPAMSRFGEWVKEQTLAVSLTAGDRLAIGRARPGARPS